MPAAAKTGAALEQLIALGARRAGAGDREAVEIARQSVELIVAEYGGRRLYIPAHEVARRARYEAIALSLAEGISAHRLARRYGLSKRRIKQIGASYSELVQKSSITGP